MRPLVHQEDLRLYCMKLAVYIQSQRTKSAYPQRMQTLLLDAARVFMLAKGVRGRCPFPPCLLTIWYYRYALTLCIAKPDPAYARHLELNTSLRTTTRNQPN